MAWTKVMCVLALLLGKGDCQNYHTENITVEEGDMLALKCLVRWDADAALQWLTPLGFVVFFNNQKVLKDRRYQLVQYSENELSISLSNITVHDEGLYTCFHYTHPLWSKEVYVTVLAPPSKPILETSMRDGEETVSLTCSTWGSKPPPKMTWLLDNGIEVYGDMKHKFDGDGKKCQTSITLVIAACHTGAVVRCIVRHKSLKTGTLTTDFRFPSFSTTDVLTDVPELGTVTSYIPQIYTAHIPSESEQAVIMQPSSAEPAISSSSTTSTQGTTEESSLTFGTELTSDIQQPKDFHGTDEHRAHSSSSTIRTGRMLDLEETTLAIKNSTGTVAYPGQDVTTLPVEKSTAITNYHARIGHRKSGVLLIILVGFLICVLLIIVQLFARKLRKAHFTWKKELEISNQTAESNRSRTNEDNPLQDRNGELTNPKPIAYVNEVFSDTKPRSSKESVDPVTPDPEDETIV